MPTEGCEGSGSLLSSGLRLEGLGCLSLPLQGAPGVCPEVLGVVPGMRVAALLCSVAVFGAA